MNHEVEPSISQYIWVSWKDWNWSCYNSRQVSALQDESF